jgi:predicted nuclease with TOPRIM domain
MLHEYHLGMKKIQDLQAETEWIKDKSKKGIFTDDEFKVELEKNRLAISLAKGELSDIYQEEVNIEEMLSKAAQFIRTLELAWLEAPITV